MPTPTPTPVPFSLAVDGDTTWGDAYDAFTPAEQDCIRTEVDDETLSQAMGQRFTDDSGIHDWQVSIFLCIDPQAARTLYTSATITVLNEAGVKVNNEEQACVRNLFEGLDIVVLFADADNPAFIEATGDLSTCVADSYVDYAIQAVTEVAEVELTPTEEERACLRDLLTGEGLAGLEADEAFGIMVTMGLGVMACMPAVFFDRMIQELVDDSGMDIELGEEEQSCVREVLASLPQTTRVLLKDNGEAETEEAIEMLSTVNARLVECVPAIRGLVR